MTSLFKGLSQAKNYATCRPTYPPAVFELIASKISSDKQLCVDIGCGTGQASVVLAEHFDNVFAVDPSETQLQNATPHEKVKYIMGTMEDSLAKFPDASVSCITSAQAAHWLDIPSFYSHVQRVLKPGGIVAIWTYTNCVLPRHPVAQDKMMHLYGNVLDGYWDERRMLVENRYQDIPLIDELYPDLFHSCERVSTGIDIEQEVTGEQLAGYLRSWSAYDHYCKEHNVEQGAETDPVLPVEIEVLNEKDILAVWPVTMLLGIKKM